MYIGAYLCMCKQASTSGSGKPVSTSSVDDLDLPNPPATLSLSQQQEYVQLTRKLALHEKKKLTAKGNVSKPSSGTSTPPTSKTSVPSAPLNKTIEKEMDEKIKVVECQKKIADLTCKRNATKALEDQEQLRITSLTGELVDCVCEITRHEQSMEQVQQQLATLQKQLEVGFYLALRMCEEEYWIWCPAEHLTSYLLL